MAELRLNPLAERIMVAGSFSVLIAAVAAVDGTVRERVAALLTRDGFTELTVAGARLHGTMRTIAETVGYHGAENGVLVAFGLTALVLFVLMFRM
jgi:hypothetical protein